MVHGDEDFDGDDSDEFVIDAEMVYSSDSIVGSLAQSD